MALPYNRGGRLTNRETATLAALQTFVGDDACIVPGTLWQRKRLRAG